MNEKELLQKINDDAESITPPASLSPEAVERMLHQNSERSADTETECQNPDSSQDTTIPFTEKTGKKRNHTILRYGSLVAVVAVAFTVFWQYQHLSIEPRDASGDSANEISEQLTYADSYEAVYQALRNLFSCEYGSDMALYSGDSTAARSVADMTAAEAAVEDSAAVDTGTGAFTDYSETNVQEQGVDEGDIVKTDGSYIYILRPNLTLAIIKAAGGDSETVSITDLSSENDACIQEMYLDGDTMSIILSEYVTTLENDEDVYYTGSRWQTCLLTYDISDRGQPVQTGRITQDGSYSDSRKNGAYLYLFTRYIPDVQDSYEDSAIVPRINDSEILVGDFYLPENLRSCDYLVISSLDISRPDEVLDSKALVSGASLFYVSTENIYIANQACDSSQIRTEITKFHYADGQITGVAAGSVRGYLNDSFSMNEYKGNLRVVSTCYGGDSDTADDLTDTYYEENRTEHNALYILDESLHPLGAIEGLAEGEIIRSARFLGDTGYFVTFRQTDPLFSVDLSDPESPQILGELKISGFSSYLHFYGENLLLGIGYEAEEETGSTTGVKLSMFDISDPANVTELNRYIIPGITWCPAIEDYKAILADSEKNLIGFYCDDRYMLFSYDEENGFTRELLYDFYSDLLAGEASYDTMRGLYIGNQFYLAGSSFLISFDMENGLEKEGLLNIE